MSRRTQLAARDELPRVTWLLDSLDLCLKRLDKGRAPHGLCFYDVIIKQKLDVIYRGQDVCACFTVGDDDELHLRIKTKQDI